MELVSGIYFDGHAHRARLRFIAMPDGQVLLAPTEDLIADRLGQWVARRRRDATVLTQAIALWAVADGMDADDRDRRIRQETAGEIGLAEFRALADKAHHPRLARRASGGEDRGRSTLAATRSDAEQQGAADAGEAGAVGSD